MRVLLIAVALILFTGTAYAACRTVTIMQNGKLTTCQVCTWGGNTTVTCF